MKFWSILGQLPSASSVGGKLNETDWLKVIRMGFVIGGSYVVVVVAEALIRDLTGGAFGIPAELTTPLTGLLSLVVEIFRRKIASPSA